MDTLEAVIGLGPNIFYGAQIAACILVFRANKTPDKEGRVLFIDASNQIKVGRAQNYLEKSHADQIYSWYSDFKNVKNQAKVVTLKDIALNDWSLNIRVYVDKSVDKSLPSVQEASIALKKSLEQVWESEIELDKLLEEFSLTSK
jgi:type I restriction enzyme M protein